jgi:hypothetical protein
MIKRISSQGKFYLTLSEKLGKKRWKNEKKFVIFPLERKKSCFLVVFIINFA